MDGLNFAGFYSPKTSANKRFHKKTKSLRFANCGRYQDFLPVQKTDNPPQITPLQTYALQRYDKFSDNTSCFHRQV
ncbi:MAG TPA: hypothetical protein DIW30_07800 [Bacteroidales bacterium]|nr:hypothetical protein [Bacteroidales bacterium]